MAAAFRAGWNDRSPIRIPGRPGGVASVAAAVPVVRRAGVTVGPERSTPPVPAGGPHRRNVAQGTNDAGTVHPYDFGLPAPDLARGSSEPLIELHPSRSSSASHVYSTEAVESTLATSATGDLHAGPAE